jgi:putative endonuclease
MSTSSPPPTATDRNGGRRAAERRGREAEDLAAAALERAGWRILGRRVRTPPGELDLVAEQGGLVAFLEVKHRPTGAEAAFSVTERQRRRIAAAAEAWLAARPDAAPAGVRFDVVVVDASGRVRRIADAFRAD